MYNFNMLATYVLSYKLYREELMTKDFAHDGQKVENGRTYCQTAPTPIRLTSRDGEQIK